MVPALPRDQNKPLQHDVPFLLESLNINISVVKSLADINLDQCDDVRVTLVDHHTPDAPLSADQVVMVIDHHDNPPNYPEEVEMKVDKVGSCSTIVFEVLSSKEEEPIDSTSATLLLGAILMDTLDLESERTTDRDREAATRLGLLSKISSDELYDQLTQKRFGRNNDSLEDLLRRDSKLVECSEASVMFSTVTCPPSQVLEDPEFSTVVRSVLASENASLSVLLFAWLQEDTQLEREIALVQLEESSDLAEGVAAQIEEQFHCKRHDDSDTILIPTSSDVTRKKVLPVVVDLINSKCVHCVCLLACC